MKSAHIKTSSSQTFHWYRNEVLMGDTWVPFHEQLLAVGGVDPTPVSLHKLVYLGKGMFHTRYSGTVNRPEAKPFHFWMYASDYRIFSIAYNHSVDPTTLEPTVSFSPVFKGLDDLYASALTIFESADLEIERSVQLADLLTLLKTWKERMKSSFERAASDWINKDRRVESYDLSRSDNGSLSCSLLELEASFYDAQLKGDDTKALEVLIWMDRLLGQYKRINN